MRVGRTYTKDLAIEPRQHDLLGLDLGEGPPRRLLGILALSCTVWWTLLGMMFGLPSQASVTWYLLPPVLLSWFGMQPSPQLGRRRRITQWLLMLRYPTIGAQPIIRLGARPADRPDRLPWRVRWGQLTRGWTALTGTTRPAWAEETPASTSRTATPTGKRRPLKINRSAIVLDDDALRRRLER